MTEEREKLRFDFLHHVSSTRGRFGCEEERVWPCTIGLNEKGGMNDEEFDKYIDNSIVPLYPDLEDTQGKRVLLKVDSGSGVPVPMSIPSFLAFQTPPPCSRRRI